MKKWMGLLLAGILVSAFLVGCKKEDEGSTDTPAATGTGGTDGKMEEKKGDDMSTTAPPAEGKMDGAGTEGAGDGTKMEGAGDGTKMEGGAGTEGAGDTKMDEKKEGG